MRFLRRFNKEQAAFGAAVALGVLMVGFSLLGGKAAATYVPPSAHERAYVRPPSRYAEFVQDDFDRVYWQGKNIWKQETVSRLPVPSIRPPEPRPADLPAPMFRPGPSTEAYNKLKAKYPCLVAGVPVVPEAEAPPAAAVEAIRKIDEPIVKPRPDRRAERVRPLYYIKLRNGKEYEGERAERIPPNHIRIRDSKSGQALIFPLDQLVKEEPNWTFEEKYQRDSQAIKPGPLEAQERLRLAFKLYEELGMVQEAEAEARRAIELRKEAVEGYLILGRICYEQGRIDEAVAIYEAGIAAGAPAAELHYEVGRCCRTLAFMEEPWLMVAAASFERALDASPRHQKSMVALARLLLEQGRIKAAVDKVTDFFIKLGGALDTRPAEKAEAYLVRGLAMVRSGDFEKARADLSEGAKLAAPLVETLRQASATGPEGGRPDPSRPAPGGPEALRQAEALHAEILNALAVVDALEGKYGQAAAAFMEVIKLNQYMIDAWTNLGTILLLAGRWADAEAVYAGAAQRDPSSAEALVGVGLAQIMAGKAEGTAALERALKVDPGHAPARAALAQIKLRTPGMEDAALDLYKEALRRDYDYVPAYYGAAAAYLRAAKKARAEAELAKEEESQELLLKAREMRLLAETLLQKARAADPSRAEVLVALGCVYAVLDRPEEAMEALRAAAQLLQNKADPLLHYAIGYVEYWHPPSDPDEKRLEKAMGSFTRCAGIEVSPQDAFGAEIVKEAKKIVDDIGDWKLTTLRLNDKFDRDPPTCHPVGGGWVVVENYGVQISAVAVMGGGRCRFSGQQTRGDFGITWMERSIPPENFNAMEVTFFPEKVQGIEYGASIYFSQQGNTWIGFHVGFNEKGQAKYNPNLTLPNDMDLKNFDIVRWNDIKVPLPDPAQVTLRIARAEKERRPVWNVFFWDQSKGDWAPAQKEITALPSAAGVRQWKVAIWGRAERGRTYSFDVDNVRIYERTKR